MKSSIGYIKIDRMFNSRTLTRFQNWKAECWLFAVFFWCKCYMGLRISVDIHKISIQITLNLMEEIFWIKINQNFLCKMLHIKNFLHYINGKIFCSSKAGKNEKSKKFKKVGNLDTLDCYRILKKKNPSKKFFDRGLYFKIFIWTLTTT